MEKKKSLEDLRRMNAEMEHESDPSKAFKESQRKKEYMEVFNLIFNRENEHPEWVKLGNHTMLSDVEERRKTILRNLHAMRRIFMGRDRSFRPFVVGKDSERHLLFIGLCAASSKLCLQFDEQCPYGTPVAEAGFEPA